jgi:hypothetical protein
MKKLTAAEMIENVDAGLTFLAGSAPRHFQTEEELEQQERERQLQRDVCFQKLLEVKTNLASAFRPQEKIESRLLRSALLLFFVGHLYKMVYPEVAPIVSELQRMLRSPVYNALICRSEVADSLIVPAAAHSPADFDAARCKVPVIAGAQYEKEALLPSLAHPLDTPCAPPSEQK